MATVSTANNEPRGAIFLERGRDKCASKVSDVNADCADEHQALSMGCNGKSNNCASFSLSVPPLLQLLADCNHVLLSGCGGGYDFVSGMWTERESRERERG